MQVAQRGTSSTGLGATSGYYTVDRMSTAFNGTAGRLTMTQESITDLPGFTKCVKLACTTADTSIAAAEYLIFSQNIEGQNLQHLAKGTSSAKKLTVSFYVKGNAAATYVCEMQDNNSREISKSFSVTTSWTRVILTYDGDTDSGGTIVNSNANGIGLIFWLHAGSNFNSGSAGDLNTSWSAAGTGTRAAGADSFFDSTSRTLFITGLQMEVGDTATDFEHRSFDDEYRKCLRYYEQWDFPDSGDYTTVMMYNESTSQAIGALNCTVYKRSNPTFSSTASSWVAVSTGSSGTAVSLTANNLEFWGCRLEITNSNTTLVDGGAAYLRSLNSGCSMALDAEL
tara:strand:- start:76 stop:1095 length:1020 start_codon:yes stop_codon:yes gene_type:complete